MKLTRISAPAKKRGGKARKDADAISGDEDPSDGEGLLTEPENREVPPRRRSGRTRGGGGGDRVATEPEPADDELDAEPITPKARPRPRATYKTKPIQPSPSRSPAPPESLRANSVASDIGDVDALGTPKVSRKRGRSEEVEHGTNEGTEDPPPDSLSNPPTPPGDIQIRRKRVRH